MLTPQEVSEKKFVKAVFGGYDMSMVDDFLELLTEDYSTLFKENAVLKSKLKVLVETVEEYRSVDDAMRKTLSNAQRMADNIIQEAEEKREEMISGAERDHQSRLEELREKTNREDRRFEAAAKRTADFIESVKYMYMTQIEALDAPFFDEMKSSVEAADKVEETAEAIFRSLESKMAEIDQPSEPEDREDTAVYEIESDADGAKTVQAPELEDDSGEGEYELTPKPKFEFQDLKFGREYQVNNKKK